MNRPAPRSIDAYLDQLRQELAGADPSLVQDALYDAEEYLRAEIAAHPGKSEADVLELISSTYGAPDEVAAAYRDTEAKVSAALAPPARPHVASAWRRFFAIYSDPRAYSSVVFMLLSLATGIIYFVLAVVGVSLSAGLSVLIIGIPFFLMFIGITRAISLGEGRLLEAITGERMPRRPVHPGPQRGFWARMGDMLRDTRTWTTIAYLVLALPLGIAYFVVAVVGLSVGTSLVFAPIAEFGRRMGWFEPWSNVQAQSDWTAPLWMLPLLVVLGIAILTALLHTARGLGRVHARYAKAMLVTG